MFDKMSQMKEMMSLLGNAGKLKERAEKVQEELARTHITGEAGGGAVKVTVSGRIEVVRVEIAPELVQQLSSGGTKADKATVEQLVASAAQQAIGKAQDLMREKLSGALGGIELPPGLGI